MRNNKGAIDISWSILVALVLSVVIMFGVPLYITAQKHDNSVELSAQSVTDELVSKVAVQGKLTQQDVDNFQLTLDSSGYHWDFDITIQKLDENSAKKTVSSSKDGKVYIVMYDTQVKDALNSGSGEILLNPGDQITIEATLATTTYSDEISGATLGGTVKNIGATKVKSSAMITGQGK